MPETTLRSIGLLVLALLAFSCDQPESLTEDKKPFFPPFEYFPESQFYQVRFGQDHAEVENQLYLLGFEKIDSSGSATFTHRTDSIEFILPDNNTLTSFKLFLRAERYLNHQSELVEQFSSNASARNEANGFAVFKYETKTNEFKLTLFAQDYLLRLSFEQKPAK
jgi:hypothetical protein